MGNTPSNGKFSHLQIDHLFNQFHATILTYGYHAQPQSTYTTRNHIPQHNISRILQFWLHRDLRELSHLQQSALHLGTVNPALNHSIFHFHPRNDNPHEFYSTEAVATRSYYNIDTNKHKSGDAQHDLVLNRCKPIELNLDHGFLSDNDTIRSTPYELQRELDQIAAYTTESHLQPQPAHFPPRSLSTEISALLNGVYPNPFNLSPVDPVYASFEQRFFNPQPSPISSQVNTTDFLFGAIPAATVNNQSCADGTLHNIRNHKFTAFNIYEWDLDRFTSLSTFHNFHRFFSPAISHSFIPKAHLDYVLHLPHYHSERRNEDIFSNYTFTQSFHQPDFGCVSHNMSSISGPYSQEGPPPLSNNPFIATHPFLRHKFDHNTHFTGIIHVRPMRILEQSTTLYLLKQHGAESVAQSAADTSLHLSSGPHIPNPQIDHILQVNTKYKSLIKLLQQLSTHHTHNQSLHQSFSHSLTQLHNFSDTDYISPYHYNLHNTCYNIFYINELNARSFLNVPMVILYINVFDRFTIYEFYAFLHQYSVYQHAHGFFNHNNNVINQSCGNLSRNNDILSTPLTRPNIVLLLDNICKLDENPLLSLEDILSLCDIYNIKPTEFFTIPINFSTLFPQSIPADDKSSSSESDSSNMFYDSHESTLMDSESDNYCSISKKSLPAPQDHYDINFNELKHLCAQLDHILLFSFVHKIKPLLRLTLSSTLRANNGLLVPSPITSDKPITKLQSSQPSHFPKYVNYSPYFVYYIYNRTTTQVFHTVFPQKPIPTEKYAHIYPLILQYVLYHKLSLEYILMYQKKHQKEFNSLPSPLRSYWSEGSDLLLKTITTNINPRFSLLSAPIKPNTTVVRYFPTITYLNDFFVNPLQLLTSIYTLTYHSFSSNFITNTYKAWSSPSLFSTLNLTILPLLLDLNLGHITRPSPNMVQSYDEIDDHCSNTIHDFKSSIKPPIFTAPILSRYHQLCASHHILLPHHHQHQSFIFIYTHQIAPQIPYSSMLSASPSSTHRKLPESDDDGDISKNYLSPSTITILQHYIATLYGTDHDLPYIIDLINQNASIDKINDQPVQELSTKTPQESFKKTFAEPNLSNNPSRSCIIPMECGLVPSTPVINLSNQCSQDLDTESPQISFADANSLIFPKIVSKTSISSISSPLCSNISPSSTFKGSKAQLTTQTSLSIASPSSKLLHLSEHNSGTSLPDQPKNTGKLLITCDHFSDEDPSSPRDSTISHISLAVSSYTDSQAPYNRKKFKNLQYKQHFEFWLSRSHQLWLKAQVDPVVRHEQLRVASRIGNGVRQHITERNVSSRLPHALPFAEITQLYNVMEIHERDNGIDTIKSAVDVIDELYTSNNIPNNNNNNNNKDSASPIQSSGGNNPSADHRTVGSHLYTPTNSNNPSNVIWRNKRAISSITPTQQQFLFSNVTVKSHSESSASFQYSTFNNNNLSQIQRSNTINNSLLHTQLYKYHHHKVFSSVPIHSSPLSSRISFPRSESLNYDSFESPEPYYGDNNEILESLQTLIQLNLGFYYRNTYPQTVYHSGMFNTNLFREVMGQYHAGLSNEMVEYYKNGPIMTIKSPKNLKSKEKHPENRADNIPSPLLPNTLFPHPHDAKNKYIFDKTAFLALLTPPRPKQYNTLYSITDMRLDYSFSNLQHNNPPTTSLLKENSNASGNVPTTKALLYDKLAQSSTNNILSVTNKILLYAPPTRALCKAAGVDIIPKSSTIFDQDTAVQENNYTIMLQETGIDYVLRTTQHHSLTKTPLLTLQFTFLYDFASFNQQLSRITNSSGRFNHELLILFSNIETYLMQLCDTLRYTLQFAMIIPHYIVILNDDDDDDDDDDEDNDYSVNLRPKQYNSPITFAEIEQRIVKVVEKALNLYAFSHTGTELFSNDEDFDDNDGDLNPTNANIAISNTVNPCYHKKNIASSKYNPHNNFCLQDQVKYTLAKNHVFILTAKNPHHFNTVVKPSINHHSIAMRFNLLKSLYPQPQQ